MLALPIISWFYLFLYNKEMPKKTKNVIKIDEKLKLMLI